MTGINTADIVILMIVMTVMAVCVRNLMIKKKNGGCSCGCSGSCCSCCKAAAQKR